MRKHAKKLIFLLTLVAVIAAFRLSGIGEYLTLETVQKHRDVLVAFVQERSVLSVLLYIIIYVVVIALNIPGGAVLTMAGGYLFGTVVAVLSVNIGATAGAVLAFLTARYLLGRSLQESYGAQLAKLNSEMDRNGARYLLTLRLIPVIPFFLVNVLAGLTRVPLTTFAWTTALGIIPASAVFAFAGQQLASVRSLGDILSPRVLAAFVLLALFTLLPALRDRFRKKP